MTFKKIIIGKSLFIGCAVLMQISVPHKPQPTLNIILDKPGAKIQHTMWGIFFEDINFSADGGLYAEQVKNRSFEFANPLMGWRQSKTGGADAALLIENRTGSDTKNNRYATISLYNDKGSFTLTNEGFRGMGLVKDETCNFAMLAHAVAGDVQISVEALNEAGAVIGSAILPGVKGDWQTYKAKFTCTETAAKGKLNVVFKGKGKVDVDMISLFPENTWKHRPGGLRTDLVQKLADLKPGFIRFPGGCIVEGRDLANRYQWKKTVGDVAGRELIMNRWNTEFSYRSAPDYFQSFGLGFFEYFQLCEDIGAAPLPILNCGMACQYNTAEVAAIPEIDPYIQDALDLVEFANGDTNTKWGRLRAALGHPAPFNLKMMGVGNEQWGEQYIERYKLFSAAIKAKYPGIKLVSSTGTDPEGERFDYLNKNMRAEKANFLDEHYYRSPDWFLHNAARYDNYERNGSKVFAGEYAAHIKDESQKDTHVESHNTWWAAISEAAFMTGLERNADVVQMASYAPLLAHVDAWQWRPDLIWFDNLHSVATPNYYVQQLFSTNKGNVVVPALVNGKALTGQDSLYCNTVIDSVNHQLIIKLVNTSLVARSITVVLKGKVSIGKQASWQKIVCNNKQAFNALDHPDAIKPASSVLSWSGKSKSVSVEGLSLNVIKIPLNNR